MHKNEKFFDKMILWIILLNYYLHLDRNRVDFCRSWFLLSFCKISFLLPVFIAGSLFVLFDKRPIGRDEIFSELQEMFEDSFSLSSRADTISSSWSRFSVWHIKLKNNNNQIRANIYPWDQDRDLKIPKFESNPENNIHYLILGVFCGWGGFSTFPRWRSRVF